MSDDIIAGVELGGTKAVALLAQGTNVIDQVTVPTRAPGETLGQLRTWLLSRRASIKALGIATFGPVRLDPRAADFGHILNTPKPGWRNTDVAGVFADLQVPLAIDTDVNAAALAEAAWGSGQGTSSLVYLTIGTGLGAGVLIEGRPVHGRLHPEAGHLRPGASLDGFRGACPFHGDCAEGLVSGAALAVRFGCDPASVPPDDPRWQAPARDLARFLAALILTLAPERIIIGGSVALGQPRMIATATAAIEAELGGYLTDIDQASLSRLIVPPALGTLAGPLGAVRLGQLAASGSA